ncbi:CAAX prenyl protease 2 [Psilocybe cubensis]|uniref:CAAX prenyl protease 2 n=2 Tax=Psilocybe cubensis TaxID=181762 RepID=A0ACB8GXH7_PSICU|nr:CAAX prenyl protease 2 [Psilocybe cubensis]KAH9480072.1 CAAX prenyl protease 2 [Psilocybe cubensis]
MLNHLLFPKPLITTSFAHYVSLGLACIYVGSLYLSKNARISLNGKGAKPRRPNVAMRDEPDVIRARLLAVSIATVACCLAVLGVVWESVSWRMTSLDIVLDSVMLRLGFPIASIGPITTNIPSILPHLITPLLFLGPLFAGFLSHELPGQRNWRWQSHIVGRFFSLHGIRNYWIGPITEEVVFRACILAVYHMSGASNMRMIFWSPLLFGLAHVHHAIDTFYAKGGDWDAAKVALFGTLFQLSYTSLFGFYASFLFLRTGSILPPITAHIFCNVMGIPMIGYELRRHAKYRNYIKAMYLAGIIGFVYTLGKWTKTKDNLYWLQEGETKYAVFRY